MGPHANFACLGKKCHTETGATVYDLPVEAKRCPVCGSQRIRRLFDAVNIGGTRISAEIVHKMDAALEPMVAKRNAIKESAQAYDEKLVPVEAKEAAKGVAAGSAANLVPANAPGFPGRIRFPGGITRMIPGENRPYSHGNARLIGHLPGPRPGPGSRQG